MTETTEAEIEAGANALAQCHFLDGEPWPLSRFPESQKAIFRDKARAVLLAAKGTTATICRK